jgi:hypothetical protein
MQAMRRAMDRMDDAMGVLDCALPRLRSESALSIGTACHPPGTRSQRGQRQHHPPLCQRRAPSESDFAALQRDFLDGRALM